MAEYQVIGTRLPRIDAIPKARGDTGFTGDLKRPGLLFGKVLRSPHPHAKILNIDVGRARSLPGVKAVVTASDTPKTKYATMVACSDRLTFASERVRFVGDAIAAVAAVDWDTAEEALELIQVDYELLPAVFDPEEAMQPDAPQIHEGVERNIERSLHRHFGNVEVGFENSDLVSEDSFCTGPQIHCQLEPTSCVAEWDAEGRVTLWVGCQGIDMVAVQTAKALDMPDHQVRVINSYVGGGFGGKGMDPLYPIAAVLAKAARRPVKMVNTREEEFVALGTRHPMKMTIKTGVNKSGTIIAREIKAIVDAGAYDKGAIIGMDLGCLKAAELYAPPNFRYDGYAVYTNNQTGSPVRGWGGVQVHFAIECQMDILAEKMGVDPLEIRLRNANQPGHLGVSGGKMSSVGLTECLTKSAEAIDWKAWQSRGERQKGDGIGMASMVHVAGGTRRSKFIANASEAYLKVENTGLVNILIGEPEIGAGSHTTLAMIAAEELGVHLEDVRINIADTSSPLSSYVTAANRVTFVGGNAVLAAARLAKQKLLETASHILEADVDDLQSRDRKIFVKGSPDRAVPFPQVVMATIARTGAPVSVRGEWVDAVSTGLDERGYGNSSPCYCFGVQVAQVEIDKETGRVEVKRIVVSQDCGFAINPIGLEGQLEGGACMGMGFTLTENLVRHEGEILNPNLHDYRLPTAMDIPGVETIFVEPIEPYGPFGAKGSGEPVTAATPPAIANAIYDAVGVRIREAPMTPEELLRALKGKTDEQCF